MLTATVRRKPWPLTVRIVRALRDRSPQALHYRDLATLLHEPRAQRVQTACWRLAQMGHLRWVSAGTYTYRLATER